MDLIWLDWNWVGFESGTGTGIGTRTGSVCYMLWVQLGLGLEGEVDWDWNWNGTGDGTGTGDGNGTERDGCHLRLCGLSRTADTRATKLARSTVDSSNWILAGV